MSHDKRKIKLVYSSSNEKEQKDVVLALIMTHENKRLYDKKMKDGQIAI